MVEMYLVILTAVQFAVIINLINKLLDKKEGPISKIKKAIRRKRKSNTKIKPVDTEETTIPKVESW
jgi:hypothetical protein